MRTISKRKDWFKWLSNNCIACSMKGGSLSAMRRSIWGNDAYVIRCNGTLFLVSEKNFKFLKNIL